jgi:nucleoside-diphosphate-sugar epimerase
MSDLCNLSVGKILVTGASGLIGSNLVKQLLSLRQDNASKISIITKSGILPKIGIDETKIEILKGDLLDLDFVQKLPRFEIIFHAAGYGQPAKFLDDTFGTLRLNGEVTSVLLKKVERGGRFIYFSSSEVYSGSLEMPNREDHVGTTDPYHPRAAYIEGKRVGETMTYLARNNFGISTTSVRIALVYGPGTKTGDSRVMNSFISRSVHDGRLEMLDMGKALRTYCFIDDAIKLITKISVKGLEPVYNLGGVETISIRKLGELIAEITDADFVLPNQNRGLESAPNVVKLDMSKTLQLFPSTFEFTPIKDGLMKTIDWQREFLLDSRE